MSQLSSTITELSIEIDVREGVAPEYDYKHLTELKKFMIKYSTILYSDEPEVREVSTIEEIKADAYKAKEYVKKLPKNIEHLIISDLEFQGDEAVLFESFQHLKILDIKNCVNNTALRKSYPMDTKRRFRIIDDYNKKFEVPESEAIPTGQIKIFERESS